MKVINIGIVGFGNLAMGVKWAVTQNPDMALAAVLTRRAPVMTPGMPVLPLKEAAAWKARGCQTIFAADLSPMSREDMLVHML